VRGGRVRGDRVEGEASSEGVLVLKGVSVPREGGAGSFPLVGIEVVSSVLIEGQTPRSIRSWRTILPYFESAEDRLMSSVLIEGQTPRSIRSWRTILPYFESAEDRLSSFLILNRRTITDYPSFFEIREGHRISGAVWLSSPPKDVVP